MKVPTGRAGNFVSDKSKERSRGYYKLLKPFTMKYRVREHVVQPMLVEEHRAKYEVKWRELERWAEQLSAETMEIEQAMAGRTFQIVCFYVPTEYLLSVKVA